MKNFKTELEKRDVAYDCRHFLGDRPCSWHKKEGLLCRCEHYEPLSGRLLIIKLDAMGDVLRTTCLLPAIAKAWPGVRIAWLTRPESAPLLENNPYITEIIPYGPESQIQIAARSFDKVINLDAGKISSGMAALAMAADKIGFILHPHGYVHATSKSAERWLRLGVFDDLKKENTRTYQDWMLDIIGLSGNGMKYILNLTQPELEQGRLYLKSLGMKLNKTIIGIHTGAGARWPQKQWGEDKIIDLIGRLASGAGKHQVVLFGGPSEKELNLRIASQSGKKVFDSGCDNSVRQVAAMLACCSVVLSGDTLAMHMALAMERRVVVMFGPTSAAEIELFGLGEKVVPDMDCLACYKRECSKNPNCMDSISVDDVIKAIRRQLDILNKSCLEPRNSYSQAS